MDNPKPQIKEYIEGSEAAKRFDALVKKVIAVPRAEIQRREEEWKRERRKQQKRVRA